MIISLCAALLCLMYYNTDHDARKHIVALVYDLYRLGYISADAYTIFSERYIDVECEDGKLNERWKTE